MMKPCAVRGFPLLLMASARVSRCRVYDLGKDMRIIDA